MGMGFVSIVVVFLDGGAEIDGGQLGEHERLEESDQQFKHTHEDDEGDREEGNTVTGYRTHLAEDEDQTEEGQRDDVTGRDVGEQSDRQYERAQENAQ